MLATLRNSARGFIGALVTRAIYFFIPAAKLVEISASKGNL
jgi:hypothetical protein